MSTRRSTRAASRQAPSDAGGTPAVTAGNIPPTPSRRTVKAASNTLPATTLRASTAYGSNSITSTPAMIVPTSGQALEDYMNDVAENKPAGSTAIHGRTPRVSRGRNGGSVRRGGSHAGDDRSFQQESGIFGDADFDNTYDDDDDDEFNRPLPGKSAAEWEAERLQRLEMERIAREQGQRVPPGRIRTWIRNFIYFAVRVGYLIHDIFWWVYYQIGLLVILVFVIWACWYFEVWQKFGEPADTDDSIAGSSGKSSVRWYGASDVTHNIGQFIPNVLAHPISYFNPDEIKDLQQRMTDAEYDIKYLKKRSDIDVKAISRLEAMLPDFIACKKDQYGDLQIPEDFWQALLDKIRSESSLFQREVGKIDGSTSSTSGISYKEVERIVEKSAGKLWDKFLNVNRGKITSWSGEELDRKFPQKLKDALSNSGIATKAEFLDLIRRNWDDTQREIKSEVAKLTKELDSTTRQIGKLEQNPPGHTNEELKNIAKDVFNKLLPSAQLEALSKANMGINTNYGLKRVNYFALGTGAAVMPYVTSPSYVFPGLDANIVKRLLSYVFVRPSPSPNPPITALTKWEEHGDCWCSPSMNEEGWGPSIGVITGASIYADQVVVEHIPPTASLEPGAAPREMELLMYMDHFDTYNNIRSMSMDIFDDGTGELQHPYPYVKIATWTYDYESSQSVQAFPVQIDVKSFGPDAHSNRFIVRAKNNWGGDSVGYICFYRLRLHGETVKQL